MILYSIYTLTRALAFHQGSYLHQEQPMPRSGLHGDSTIPSKEWTNCPIIQQWGLRAQSVMTSRRLTVTHPRPTNSCAPIRHAGQPIRGLETHESTHNVEPNWCGWAYIAYPRTSTPYQLCLWLTGQTTTHNAVLAATLDSATSCDGHGAGPSSAAPRMRADPVEETPVYVKSSNDGLTAHVRYWNRPALL